MRKRVNPQIKGLARGGGHFVRVSDAPEFERVTLYQHKVNGKYYVSFYDRDRRALRFQSLRTKVFKMAVVAARQRDMELERAVSGFVNQVIPHLKANTPKLSLEDAMERGISMADGSDAYRKQLKRFARYVTEWRDAHRKNLQEWADVTRADLEAYVTFHEKAGRKRNTVIGYMKPFLMANKAAQKQFPGAFAPLDLCGVIPEVSPEPLKYLSPEQAKQFLDWARNHPRRAIRKAGFVVALGAFAGLRLTEILRLTPRDFDGENITIRVSKTESGARVFPLTEIAKAEWLHYMASLKVKTASPDAPIITLVLNRLSTLIKNALRDAADALGVQDFGRVSPHEAMRKTFCNILADVDLSDRYQDALLGHAPTDAVVRRTHYASFRVRPDDLDHVKERGIARLKPAVAAVDDFMRKNMLKNTKKNLKASNIFDLVGRV